jgi:hypothetical protein
MAAIPCDNQIRAMLDPVDPALFFPVFTDVMGALERGWRSSAACRAGC